jgi:predicted N-acyltransferase
MAVADVIEVRTSISDIAPSAWNALAGDNPFLQHEYLDAMHRSGCASTQTGWTPQYLLLTENGTLTGAMPLYLKTHSYGEYVFDWAWADAYQRHGLQYYPKLLCAVPFTPVGGRRLLAATPERRARLLAAALDLARVTEVSSLHCLFPADDEAAAMQASGMLLRSGLQFHWRNAGYRDFEAFLAGMVSVKRKKIRQERRRVREAGITFEWIAGSDLTDDWWIFFTRCYAQTYRQHGATPYLNLQFFRDIGRRMPDNILLVVARREGRPVAASLNLHNAEALFGRYWGCLEYHPALHFETCYYQVIEYCLTRGIRTFEGGAQGEHKMARGLLPVETRSAHWLAHPRFAAAVEEYLSRERANLSMHIDELDERSPYRHDGGGPAEPPPASSR